jgi:2'-5' RNA ligase
MRIFVALALDDAMKDALANIQRRLRPHIPDAKWVEPENIHLTLKFLGEIEEKMLKDVVVCCENVADSHQPFLISLSEIGGFPSLSYPRVIWIGIADGKEEVSLLAEELDRSLAKAGFPKEKRPFTPHLTLARIKRERKVSVSKIEPVSERMEVRSIQIIQSTLTPKGPIYRVVKSISL